MDWLFYLFILVGLYILPFVIYGTVKLVKYYLSDTLYDHPELNLTEMDKVCLKEEKSKIINFYQKSFFSRLIIFKEIQSAFKNNKYFRYYYICAFILVLIYMITGIIKIFDLW